MSFIQTLLRKKSPGDTTEGHQLVRCLTAVDLTLMGIGAIIGAGIFVLTGIAAATKAGPAVMLSYALAGLACGFSALSYAELASSIGGCGSAYGYAYAGLGEIFAWIIGWDLLLEYGLSSAAVAMGWSGYLIDVLQAMGINVPHNLRHGLFEGGIINLPAFGIIIFITGLLAIGVKQSVRFNGIIVAIKLLAIAIFIAIAAIHFDIKNWHPFLPFGWQGVANGAALIFFAYIGFDAVSTAAEEALRPQRDLPIGIIASLVICTLLYIVVSGLLTGIVSYTTLNVTSPVAHALLQLNQHLAAGVVAVGAIAGLTTVILVMYYGLTRILLAMTRDGLLIQYLKHINPKTHTPLRIIFLTGGVMSVVAAFMPIESVAELINIGTLAAFVVVCCGVIVLRITQPDLVRGFKTPFSPTVPIIGVILCIYLMFSLPWITWLFFLLWSGIGFVVYFGYSRWRSVLGRKSGS